MKLRIDRTSLFRPYVHHQWLLACSHCNYWDSPNSIAALLARSMLGLRMQSSRVVRSFASVKRSSRDAGLGALRASPHTCLTWQERCHPFGHLNMPSWQLRWELLMALLNWFPFSLCFAPSGHISKSIQHMLGIFQHCECYTWQVIQT